jgi:hypothetical protein
MPTVISTYARGETADATLAQLVFNEMAPTYHDLGSWNVVVSTHKQNGLVMDTQALPPHVWSGQRRGEAERRDTCRHVLLRTTRHMQCWPRRRAVCSGENKWNGKLRQ